MTITPAITTTVLPGVEITMTGDVITYEEFLNILGEWVFMVKTMYYLAGSIQQFNTPIAYSAYDANGNRDGSQIVTPISPGQFQPSQYVQMKGRNVIIDGQSQMNFNLMAGEGIQLIFYCIRKRVQDDIDNAGYINNFEKTESEMGISGFFKDADDIQQDQTEVFPDDY